MKNIIENANDLMKQFYENHFTTIEVDFWKNYIFTLNHDDASYKNFNKTFNENII